MARLGMLPTVASLALAGAGLGAYFGQAAVDSINPFYATDPDGAGSYAALTPQGVPQAPTSGPAHLADADQGWGSGCIGCARLARNDRPKFGGEEPSAVPPASIEAAVEDYPLFEVETDPDVLGDERRLVQLYAHYPVSQEESEAHHAAVAATLAGAETIVENGAIATDGAEWID